MAITITMKNIIQKLINFNAYINMSPFSVPHVKFGNIRADMSDFFAFRLDGGYETIFIAENNLALLSGEHVKCTHVFNFFNGDGVPCGTHKVDNSEFHYRFKIDKRMTSGIGLGGFVHHINYSNEVLGKYKKLLHGLSFQHRGYTGFKKVKDFGYSYVHGNFGAMYYQKSQKIKSLSRLRGKHVYTPQFIIRPNFNYDFIFSNPASKKACIEFVMIDGNSKKTLKKVCIDSHATYKLTLDKSNIMSNCNISWETNFPVGRCVVFEYNEENFDVFHS
jgi:hypothetical protein